MLDGPLASSFRDPSGFVFVSDETIFRQVNRVYEEDWRTFLDSGLYQELVEAGLILPVAFESAEKGMTADAIEVLRPEHIPLISYPYEWCFSQLKDAALLTLELMRRALGRDQWLKDASAYNIQFYKGRAVHMDTLSFERYREGEAWPAYGQFCRHFLAPLALAAFVDIRLFGQLRPNIDGIPLDFAAKLLPGKTKVHFGLLTHIHMHGKAATSEGGDAKPRPIPKAALLGMLDNLEKTVQGLTWDAPKGVWGDYYSATNYSGESFEAKKAMVRNFVRTVQPRPLTCWDLGANTGVFSEVVAEEGIDTWAWDYEIAATEQAYQRWKSEKRTNLVPLVQDFANPSPNLGWANRERDSFGARGPVDLAMALALIHHLAIGNNVPLREICRWLGSLAHSVILEFVPKEDSQVQRMLRSRKDIFDTYHEEGFESAASEFFNVIRKESIPGTKRTLYLLQGKNA